MKKQTKFAASIQYTVHSTLNYLRCKVKKSVTYVLLLFINAFMVVTVNSSKRVMIPITTMNSFIKKSIYYLYF